MSYRYILLPGIAGIIVAASCLALAGCGEGCRETNRCLDREIFNECMASLPAGPSRTHYNDWDEVVEACEIRAYRQSLRRPRDIPAGCR